MKFSRLIIGLVGILISFTVFAVKPLPPDEVAHQDFWNPTYHIQRLNYCLIDGKTCGLPVAKCFCKLLGFYDAAEAKIANNVGYTNFLNTSASCKGWKCHGFKVIRCIHRIKHHPAASYYYRLKKFPLPRFANYRIDWCLKKNQHCGKPAANSFCKRLGYMHAQSYKKQSLVFATKTLGSQALCFGSQCTGFREIICYR